MTLVKAARWHFDAIKEDNRAGVIDDILGKEVYKQYADLPSSFTLLDGSDILAIGGVAPLWPGVAEVWMVRSKDFASKPMAAREIKKLLKVEMQKYHRVQATCLNSDEVCKNFLCWLGFGIEGVMRKFGPDGSDFTMYARV